MLGPKVELKKNHAEVVLSLASSTIDFSGDFTPEGRRVNENIKPQFTINRQLLHKGKKLKKLSDLRRQIKTILPNIL